MQNRLNINWSCLITFLLVFSSLQDATGQEQVSTWSQRALPLPNGRPQESDIGRQFRLMQQLQKLIGAPAERPLPQRPDGLPESWLNPEMLEEWTRTLNSDQKKALQRLAEQFKPQSDSQDGLAEPERTQQSTEEQEPNSADQAGREELERQLQQFLRDRQLPEFKPSRQSTQSGIVQEKIDDLINRGQALPPLERPSPAPSIDSNTAELENAISKPLERQVNNLNQRGLERTIRDIVRETQNEVKQEAILEARRAAQAKLVEAKLVEAKLVEQQRKRLEELEGPATDIAGKQSTGATAREDRAGEPIRSNGSKLDGSGGNISSEMLDRITSSHQELEKMIRDLQNTKTAKNESVEARPDRSSSQQPKKLPTPALGLGQDQNSQSSPSFTDRMVETYRNLTSTTVAEESKVETNKADAILGSEPNSKSRAFSSIAALILVFGSAIMFVWWKHKRGLAIDSAQTAKNMYASLVPINITSGEDVIKAFHYLALASTARPQQWWPHPMTAEVLATTRPADSPAVQQLAAIYEIARYSPEGTQMTPEQLARASTAVNQILH